MEYRSPTSLNSNCASSFDLIAAERILRSRAENRRRHFKEQLGNLTAEHIPTAEKTATLRDWRRNRKRPGSGVDWQEWTARPDPRSD